MKRKYEYIAIFLLALVLMLLASCSTKQTCIAESMDSVRIATLNHSMFECEDIEFDFDSMIIVTDACVNPCINAIPKGSESSNQHSQMILVKGGSIKTNTEKKSITNSTDSTRMKKDIFVESTTKPPQNNYMILALIIIILFVLKYIKAK